MFMLFALQLHVGQSEDAFRRLITKFHHDTCSWSVTGEHETGNLASDYRAKVSGECR